jgi:hypothetical protein
MDMFVGQSYFGDILGVDWTRRVLSPYREWVAALPEPLGAISRDLLDQEVENSNLVHFPWLVAEPFGLPEHSVEELVVAGALTLTYFLASDRLFDAPDTADRATILLATLLHAELLRRYERVAPGRAAHIWHEIATTHVRGLLAEERHHAAVRAEAGGLAIGDYERIVAQKNCYGAAVVRILGASTGRHDIEATLRLVFDHIAVEIEFDDDLKDWEEDLTDGRFTPVVSLLIGAGRSSRPDDLRAALVTSPAIADILDRIDGHLGAAEILLREVSFPHSRLSGWLARHREANRRLRADVVARQVSTALARSLVR